MHLGRAFGYSCSLYRGNNILVLQLRWITVDFNATLMERLPLLSPF